MTVSSFLSLIGVGAILPFIQSLLTPEVLLQNKIIQNTVNAFPVINCDNLEIIMGITVALVYVIKNLFLVWSTYIKCNFLTKIKKELSINMLYSYLRKPYEYFLDVNSADIVRGCSSDVNGTNSVIGAIISLFTEVFMTALITLYLLYTDFIIATLVVGLLVLVVFTIMVVLKPIIREAGIRERDAVRCSNKAIFQAVHGIKEIFVMQRQDSFIKNYEQATELTRKSEKVNSITQVLPDRVIEGVCVSGMMIIICLRLSMNVEVYDFVPKLAVFAVAAFTLMPSIGKIAGYMNILLFNREYLAGAYETIQGMRNLPQELDSNVKIDNFNISEKNISFENKLSIENVKWHYKNQNSDVLSNVSMTIYKGESVAFIGVSGSGKTTLADIILNLLNPQRGTVKMDNIDIHTIPKQWSNIVGYVPQSVYLIDDSVRNNIAFGLPAADISDQKIWDALDKAQLKEFVMGLPEKLDTIVGERGVKFSGGQRQRVAIARALYNDPQILIMDEATAALDNETENAVMESIEALQGRVTLIIVAHRLTTIRNCDVVYEIRDGKAVMRNKEDVIH